ncbi:transporter substrate-binding domain-containing protein [Thalassomonas viridans]|uniref:Transporter substrate-binding domain-containing protein n=1 Tax=Thalassomonas viridans TaxID=137584 RepID=A0AAE9Z9Q7_9GAMM|nr:transporter substrate-binding domain-containing protein [Thalassomonas viridans]WDE07682.1 transporter substrate-binding domain-containing protein [Thalassomonas viridans]
MMKKLFLPVCLLIASSAGAVKSFAQETIRIATGEYPPYYSRQYKNFGPTPAIVIAAFARVNIKVEFGFFPWNRSLELAKNNVWDATCCWFKTSGWEDYFYYSDGVRSREKIFFHLKSYPFHWQSYDDLQEMKIGTTVKYAYGDDFDAANKAGKLRIEQAPSNKMNLKKLLAGRIHIFPIDRLMGYQLLDEFFTPEQARLITHHSKILFSGNVRLLISKKNPKSQYLIEKFNLGLKKLKESGEYDPFFIEKQPGGKNE